MNNKNKEVYGTKHHPDDVFMVPINILHPNNIEILSEHIIPSHNGKSIELRINTFKDLLSQQISKLTDENTIDAIRIFDSSEPCLVYFPLNNLPSYKKIEIKNMSLKFSDLEKEKDIISFAKTYGLLGVLNRGWNNYSDTYFETFNTWYTYIEHIKRLIKLYKALRKKKRGKDIEVIGEFFILEEKDFYHLAEGNIKKTTINWTDKYRINVLENIQLEDLNNIAFQAPELPRELEESIEYDGLIGSYILARLIQEGLREAVQISFSEVFKSDVSPIGFSFNETYSSQYLLGAIYQDLWTLINADVELMSCNYCNKNFEHQGKKIYCNDSCRQMAYKGRKNKGTQ